jgi:DNA-binding NtrC family response regulator
LDKAARKHLQQHAWSGNVRELRNLCERLSILLAGRDIGIPNLPLELRNSPHSNSHAQTPFSLPESGVNLDELERDLLTQALTRAQHNKSHAARLLGISRDALNYRLKKYALG